MVRDPLTGRTVRLRGADIHAAIHLCGVDAHDLERQSVGEFEGNVGLARARWAMSNNAPRRLPPISVRA